MVIVRENAWVRVWQMAAGNYVDSKYRTYECDASADEVILAWQMAAESERQDIEDALEFFPYSRKLRRICHFLVAISGIEVARRIEERWFTPEKMMRAETLAFLKEASELGTHKILICDTPWFRAYWDGFSYDYQLDGKLQSTPDYQDFCGEYVKAHSRLHRDLLNRYWGFPREA
jgi:hypothetical protein